MNLTIVTRPTYGSSAISTEVSAVVGGFDKVRGWNIACTLADGESKIVWLSAFVILTPPFTWPVRVTNLGDGNYHVSRPFPWIFRKAHEMRRAVKPSTIQGREQYVAVIG